MRSLDQTAAEVERFRTQRAARSSLPTRKSWQGARVATRSGSAHHGIVVFIDADTQCQRDTLPCLLEPFADARIGAVSGHAKVGICAHSLLAVRLLNTPAVFNLDRRAYDRWNASQ